MWCFQLEFFQIWIWGLNGFKAMELESLNRLKRVVVVRPIYVLFSLETESPKEHLNIYTTFFLSRSSVEGEIIRLEVLNLLY